MSSFSANACLFSTRISRPCSEWLRISRRIEQSAESEIVRPTILTLVPETRVDLEQLTHPVLQED